MLRPAVFVTALIVATAAAPVAQDAATILGAWQLNPELGTPPPPPPGEGWPRERPPGDARPPDDDGPPTGGRPRSAPPGAVFGGLGGIPGLGRGPSNEDLRRAGVIRRRLAEAPASLVIVRDGSRVTLTDGEGRTLSYLANGKKEDRFTGDGEFTSKTHTEGPVLVVEEDFGGGVTLMTRYAPIVSEGRERLEVMLEANGLPKPRTPKGATPTPPLMNRVTRIYERG